MIVTSKPHYKVSLYPMFTSEPVRNQKLHQSLQLFQLQHVQEPWWNTTGSKYRTIHYVDTNFWCV